MLRVWSPLQRRPGNGTGSKISHVIAIESVTDHYHYVLDYRCQHTGVQARREVTSCQLSPPSALTTTIHYSCHHGNELRRQHERSRDALQDPLRTLRTLDISALVLNSADGSDPPKQSWVRSVRGPKSLVTEKMKE